MYKLNSCHCSIDDKNVVTLEGSDWDIRCIRMLDIEGDGYELWFYKAPKGEVELYGVFNSIFEALDELRKIKKING